jgi:hypothetical protein
MSIAIEFDKLDGRAEQGGGFLCLGRALFGRAMRARFAA